MTAERRRNTGERVEILRRRIRHDVAVLRSSHDAPRSQRQAADDHEANIRPQEAHEKLVKRGPAQRARRAASRNSNSLRVNKIVSSRFTKSGRCPSARSRSRRTRSPSRSCECCSDCSGIDPTLPSRLTQNQTRGAPCGSNNGLTSGENGVGGRTLETCPGVAAHPGAACSALRLRRAEILDFTRAVWEIDDLWISREERETVSRSGRNRKAVAQSDRRSCLQARRLDHPGCPRKIRREYGAKISQRLIRRLLPLVTRHSVIDLHEVDPAHHRTIAKRLLDPGERRLLPVQPGQDSPRVQADAHRGSRARSSSRRAAMPVFANRPPSCKGDRRATSTISSSRNSKSTSSPGCKRARSRSAFGITTCPLAPIRPVIPWQYNSLCGAWLASSPSWTGLEGRLSKHDPAWERIRELHLWRFG
jgi:hypothetical protein